ncbi:response regulator [Candidatus Mycosynbacter amalyticus]|uniref:Response regulator n=1 Tax=Candidatus Mycosynbacter amalyticus TaxID=2665156 RepID=A0A857MJK2_9BACT|nr:response regulator transcription factor [Candidatus Mycosynbacter amalyticus]QHN42754.1 response regulator [Candidatus Mycosynbacter amalyticus]
MRILVIEDEVKIANALARALRGQGYAVDVEHDSDGGYAMASTEPYDIMIVDRLLPGEYADGVALLRKLREEDIDAPALILTALGSTEQKTEGLDAGADDYLTKPFSVDELLARVRALLRRPTIHQDTVLRAGKLSLNTTLHETSYDGELLDLTVKEQALLEYLMRSEGRPVSKEQIISHVWDFDADILPNTVEVYIKYLRGKIDNRFKVHYIKTVRGVGYKFEAH